MERWSTPGLTSMINYSQPWGRSSVVEQTTFNRLAEGSIPSALTILHNPSPISRSFPACLLLVVFSDSRLLYQHDPRAQGKPSLFQGNRRRNNQPALDNLFFHGSSFLPLCGSRNWRF